MVRGHKDGWRRVIVMSNGEDPRAYRAERRAMPRKCGRSESADGKVNKQLPMPNDGCSGVASVLERQTEVERQQHESKGPRLEWHCGFAGLMAHGSLFDCWWQQAGSSRWWMRSCLKSVAAGSCWLAGAGVEAENVRASRWRARSGRNRLSESSADRLQ
jgi:hypothetical protein